jgi:hypothetical protein
VTAGEAELVDDRTWSELEMDAVFDRLDKSITPLGAQYLYSLLRTYRSAPEPVSEWVPLHRELKAQPAARQNLRGALGRMDRQDTADLAGFILGPPQTVPQHWKWYYFLPGAMIVSLLGLFFNHWFLFPAVAIGFFNIFVHYRHGQAVERHGPSLVALGTLLATVRQILRDPDASKLPEVQELRRVSATIETLHKKVSRNFLRAQVADDFSRILFEHLNLVLLFELLSCCGAIEAMNESRETLAGCLGAVGRLDALQGLADSLPEFPHFCIPEITRDSPFVLEDVFHPLLEKPVCNTLTGTGRSMLLSGANMAGKTTLMKALAINLLLAQTVGVCLARKAVLPPARVRTLINRDDKATSGQSYFFHKASALLRMLKSADAEGGEYWFIIDEIFRGTNTIERIAAGSAVLGHLARRWMLIASTHDDELLNLLGDRFDSYHFSEVIADNAARFDYLLKKGPCPTRNAIKLLVLAGYPAEVTDLAQWLADKADSDG